MLAGIIDNPLLRASCLGGDGARFAIAIIIVGLAPSADINVFSLSLPL